VRGSSGANIVISAQMVAKYDTAATSGRVAEQGEWIYRHLPCESLPHIYSIQRGDTASYYAMERVIPLAMRDDAAYYVYPIASVLTHTLWRRQPETDLNVQHHLAYVADLLRETHQEAIEPMLRQSFRIMAASTDGLIRCLTHGDPIVDNLAFRENGTIVVLDPIPSTTALPDLLCSDVGRLVQSAAGYEYARYDVKGFAPELRAVAQFAYGCTQLPLTDTEYTMVLHFAIIHSLRGVRSAMRRGVDSRRIVALEQVVQTITKELNVWTR
jgi:hypothetical protein